MCFEIECIMALQGHPRSLILAPIESAYATSYWSSINSKLSPIFPRLRDIAGFLLWRATASLFHPNIYWGVPFGLDCRRYGSEERKP